MKVNIQQLSLTLGTLNLDIEDFDGTESELENFLADLGFPEKKKRRK